MVADRLGREIAWDQEPIGEPSRFGRAALRDERDPFSDTRSAAPNLLPQLMREAARALQAAESRAAALEQHMADSIETERRIGEALRAEQARADAAESRATAAEDRLEAFEQRALAAIRVLERRAEVAEARVQAAETWIDRVRSAVSSGPDELAAAEPRGTVQVSSMA